MFSTAISIFKNKEIRKKILFTLLMLFIFRFGASIPVPGVDSTALIAGMGDNSLLGLMNLLGGGNFERFSVFAMGVGPYITSSIIIQILSMDVIPQLSELSKQGQVGRKQIDRYTRYLGVALCLFQSATMTYAFDKTYGILEDNAISTFMFVSVILTAGTMFLLWLGDQISAKGIGNGVSMIIFAGIVSNFPAQFTSAYNALCVSETAPANGQLLFGLYCLTFLVIIVFVTLMNNANRRIPIQYTSSGAIKAKTNELTYLPLKINSASVMPVIFASSVMVAPVTIASFFPANGFTTWLNNVLNFRSWHGLILYVVLIILFTFFYTNLQVDPEKITENLNKSGTYIPGIRPGNDTKNYVSTVLNRITVVGSIALAFIAILPHAIPLLMPALSNTNVGLGGTGVIIVVGVAIETVKSLTSQVTQKTYKGFLTH